MSYGLWMHATAAIMPRCFARKTVCSDHLNWLVTQTLHIVLVLATAKAAIIFMWFVYLKLISRGAMQLIQSPRELFCCFCFCCCCFWFCLGNILGSKDVAKSFDGWQNGFYRRLACFSRLKWTASGLLRLTATCYTTLAYGLKVCQTGGTYWYCIPALMKKARDRTRTSVAYKTNVLTPYCFRR